MKRNWRSITGSRLLDLLTVFVVFAFLFPYLFMVSSAFKSRLETFAYPPVFLQFTPTLEHFDNIFNNMHILFYMKNSTIIAVCSTLLTILIAIPATYAFARFRLWFSLLADGAGHLNRIRAFLHRARAGLV